MVELLAQQESQQDCRSLHTTGVAVSAIRARWSMPIVAIERAIKPPLDRHAPGLVLATVQTIASPNFRKLLVESIGGTATVLSQLAPPSIKSTG